MSHQPIKRFLSIRLICLSCLCLHYSFLTVILHISRTSNPVEVTYRPSCAVLITELLKLTVSIIVSTFEIVYNRPCDTSSTDLRKNSDSELDRSTTGSESEESESSRDEGEDEGWDEDSDRLVSNVMSEIKARKEEDQDRLESDETEEEEEEEEEEEGLLNSEEKKKKKSDEEEERDDRQEEFGRIRRRTTSSTTLDHVRTTSSSIRLSVRPSPPSNSISNDQNHQSSELERSRSTTRRARSRRKADLNSDWLDVVVELYERVFSHGWWKLGVPAVMFVAQNNLQYIAASNLSVPLLQITYQLKILTTALCSVILLKRRLNQSQWLALILLTIGVAAVQLHNQTEDQNHTTSNRTLKVGVEESDEELVSLEGIDDDNGGAGRLIVPTKGMNKVLGLTAVIAACLSSGFSTVYFEKVLKTTNDTKRTTTRITVSNDDNHSNNRTSSSLPSRSRIQSNSSGGSSSIWIRNAQLSLFGLIMSVIVILIENVKSDQDYGSLGGDAFKESVKRGRFGSEEFFQGFTPLVWTVIVAQIFGGFLNGFVIKYTDNILKGFATSISILISFGVSMVLFDFKISPGSFIGGALVLVSTWLFNSKSSNRNIQ